ncbi:MAG: ATP-binding cassette domain-containing protein, partial [Nitratireductor sp.]
DKVLEEEERDLQKLDRKIVREEHWLRYGVSARRTRNMRRLGALHDLRQQRRDTRGAIGQVSMEASATRESGKLVIEAFNVSKAYDGRTLVDDFSTRIARGDRVGFVGPNGVGKTTLLKMLIGELKPDSGRVKLGTNLDLAFLDQKRAALADDLSVQDAITEGRGDQVMVNGEPRHVVGYLRDFLFTPEQIRTPAGKLSGGERARLLLAKTLATPANFLVLDEPTNDLDMETLDLLQELVAGFPGTVILVSHDRDFLDRTVTSTIAPEGGGRWVAYAGGYSDMLAQRGSARFALGGGDKKGGTKPDGAPSSSVASAARPQPARQPARKLSYKQKFALETLPGKIDQAEAEIEKLEARLADPEFYVRDPDGFAKIAARLDGKKAELAAMEEEWLELEMLRETVEQG